jgi:hypothetical protein
MLNRLKQLFAKKICVTFWLKSGDRLTIKARSVEIEKNGNELIGYNLDGIKPGQPFYVKLEDISAITYEQALL